MSNMGRAAMSGHGGALPLLAVLLCLAGSPLSADHAPPGQEGHHNHGSADHSGDHDAGHEHHAGHGEPGAATAGHPDGHGHTRPDSVAPPGVMGDHLLHETERWMVSYRFMTMSMEDSRDGTDRLSTAQVLATPNRFFGRPGQPPTLRIVPTEMTMDMHMLGVMFAPSANLTLMAMATYLDKEMDHTTYKGGMGTTVLGTFTTETSGIGDTKLGLIYALGGDSGFHLNLGLGLPTGSVTETGTVLTPMNMRPTVRLPYAMQPGTGTYDLLAGLTYTGRTDDLSWGAQFRSEIRLESENDEGYSWGDLYGLTGWIAAMWADWVSTSARFDARTQSSLSGIDPRIAGPVQTANPDFYGGDQVFGYLGVNTIVPRGALAGHRLELEVGLPLYRNLNGPQLETDWTLTLAWRKSF